MRKILFLIVGLLLVTSLFYGAPSNTVSIPNSFSPNTVIKSSETNANNAEIQSKYNAHGHTDIIQVGTITTGAWNATPVTTQYGGTGQNFSSVASGSIVFFNGVGSIGALGLGTANQVLTINSGSSNFGWSSSGFNDVISRGFEASASTLKTAVLIYPGTLSSGSAVVNKTTATTLGLNTAGDYSSGSVVVLTAEDWNYIGVDNSGNIKLLGTIAPAYDDSLGNSVSGSPHLYSLESAKYWRIIGAVRMNTSNQCVYGYFQQKDYIQLDTPVTLTTSVSTGSWSGGGNPLDCNTSGGMPAISRKAKFGIYLGIDGGGNQQKIWIRPNGSVLEATPNTANGNGVGPSSGYLGMGETESMTDTSQKIQYYCNGTGAISISIKGYYLNIR